jgi:hypothetical protein
MLPNIFFLLFCSIVFLSCNSGNENKSSSPQNQNTNQDTLPVNDSNGIAKKKVQNRQTDSPYTKITQQTVIEVRTVNKKFDTTSKFLKVYAEKCDNWKLNEEGILNILRNSKEMDGQEFHHYYDVLPCYYSGKVSIDGNLASYEINAGAFTTLFYKDTSVYLGYKKDDYRKYFLVGPGIE